KRIGFPAAYAQFQEAGSYRDWVFRFDVAQAVDCLPLMQGHDQAHQFPGMLHPIEIQGKHGEKAIEQHRIGHTPAQPEYLCPEKTNTQM
ncbi:MAG: hypothetical protein ACLGG6_09740, partial [Gammaproteobacteria bacterium]